MANTISTRFTQQAQEVAYLAAEVIKRYDHNMIDTEHLLLALIEYPNGIASKVLNNLNVNIERLTEQINLVLRAD